MKFPRFRNFWQWDRIRTEHFVLSRLVPVEILLFWRTIALGLILSIWVVKIATDWSKAAWFRYFSWWSFIILSLYFLLSTLLSLRFVQLLHTSKTRRYPKEESIASAIFQIEHGSVEEEGRFRSMRKWYIRYLRLLWILFVTSLATAPFVDVAAWIAVGTGYRRVITNEDQFGGNFTLYPTIGIHAINLFLLLVEVFLTDVPAFPWSLAIFPISFGLLFMFFAWIYYGASSSWIYQPMNWSKPYAVGIYFAAWGVFLVLIFLGRLLLQLLHTRWYYDHAYPASRKLEIEEVARRRREWDTRMEMERV